MSATRTQVYLTEEQRSLIDAITRATGVTMAEVIRKALDQYLVRDSDPASALSATFGAVPDLEVPPRNEWDRG